MSADDSRRLGATAALLAMLKLERIAEKLPAESETLEGDQNCKAEALKAITDAVGPLQPFQSGFVEAMAEYLMLNITAGLPNLLVWLPKAAMSNSQLEQARKNLEELYAEEIA